MTEYLLVLISTGSQQEAKLLAKLCVEHRLAGSAQVVGPLIGTYWWKGRVCVREAWQCQARTTRDRYAELEALIRRHHSDEEPGIIAIPILAGSQSYLTWLYHETREPISPSSE